MPKPPPTLTAGCILAACITLITTCGGCVTVTYESGDERLQITRFGAATEAEAVSTQAGPDGRSLTLDGYRSDTRAAIDLARDALDAID